MPARVLASVVLVSLVAAGCGGNGSSGGGDPNRAREALFGGSLMFINAQLHVYGNTFADFDGDGFEDAIAQGFNDSGDRTKWPIWLQRGSSTEVFGAPETVGTGELGGIGDFNGDGLIDFVSVSETGGRGQPAADVAIHFALPDKSFSAPVFLGASSETIEGVGDVDGDGDPDIVLQQYNGTAYGFSTLKNTNGGSTWINSPATFLASTDFPKKTFIVDATGDGCADLVVVETNHERILELVSRCDGTFSEPQTLLVSLPGRGLVVDDFTGDGLPDLVIFPDLQTLMVQPGQGDGTFGQAITTPTQPFDGWPGLGVDLDGDGKKDLLLWGTAGLCAAYGLGDGHFNTNLDVLSDENTSLVHVMDADRDGIPDLLQRVGSFYQLFFGEGKGSFRAEEPAFIPLSETSRTLRVPFHDTATDVNGDSNPDIVLVHRDSPGISVLLGRGDGTFLPEKSISFDSVPNSGEPQEFADLDGDGLPDLFGSAALDGYVTIVKNYGGGDFRPLAPIQFSEVSTGFLAADLDQDGHMDLIFAAAAQSLGISFGLGNMQFEPAIFIPSPERAAFEVRDMNGDGLPDLVSTELTFDTPERISVILNAGGRNFDPPMQTPVEGAETGFSSVEYADLNHDGRLDAVVGVFETAGTEAHVWTYFGQLDGSFVLGQEIPLPANSTFEGFITADNNGDGYMDVETLTSRFNFGELANLFTFLNDGNGQFTSHTAVSLYPGSPAFNLRSVEIRDITGDGLPDALFFTDTSILSVAPGLPDGSFHEPYFFRMPRAFPFGLFGDFDRDGDVDIAATTWGFDSLILMENRFKSP